MQYFQLLLFFSVMILVNTTDTSTEGSGQSITTNTLAMFGYDNATAGQDGYNVYESSNSTDPAYAVSK